MAKTWMEAAHQEGIPTAFVVDKKGNIAWIGHPMQLKEEILEQVLQGKFDVAKAAADYAKAQKSEEQVGQLWATFNRAREQEQWDQAESTLADIEKLTPEGEREGLDMRR